MKKTISKFSNHFDRNFILFDVGARGGIQQPWSFFDPLIEVTSFEPDETEYRQLTKKKTKGRVFNYALYKKTQNISLNLTRQRGCSSIYEPNFDMLNNFHGSSDFEVEGTERVEAISLDELSRKEKISNIDFIKIDVQGAELDVLKGGKKLLNEQILGIELEVEFQKLYKDQPLFADIDVFIRNELELDLQDLKKYYWKYPEGVNYGSAKGKLIFGEALYFRTPDNVLKLCEKKPEQEAKEKLIMAIFMGIVYGYIDYPLTILSRSKTRKFFKKEQIIELENIIKSYGKGLRYTGRFAPHFSEIFRLLYRLFQPTHEGWGSIGQPLGTRKKMRTFY